MNTSYTSYAPVISVHNLTKSYGQHTVLRDISLDIYPGESVAVMGPSGSGKTTLLHALSGIIRIDSGTIQVLGGGPEIPGGRVELGALSENSARACAQIPSDSSSSRGFSYPSSPQKKTSRSPP